VMLTTHPHLVPRSWMSRSYTSSPPKRLHGVYRDCFTLFYSWSVVITTRYFFVKLLFIITRSMQTFRTVTLMLMLHWCSTFLIYQSSHVTKI